MRRVRAVVAAALSAAALVALRTAPARGQERDAAAAEILFEQAIQLMNQARYDEACPRLAESQRIDPGVGTLLYLGDCYEKLGKTASAWATFREAADAAQRNGQPDRERAARTRVAALEGSLSTVILDVPVGSAAPGLVLRRDGREVAGLLWGTPVPVDPGVHTVEASAPGRATWTTSVTVDPGSRAVSVTVPPLEPAAASPPAFAPTAPAAAPPGPATPPPAPGASGLPLQRVLAVAVAGAGVAGMGVSLGIGIAARSRFNEAAPYCDGDLCDAQGVEIRADAKGTAQVGTVVFVAGAAALAAGAVLWIATPSPKGAGPRSAALSLGAGPGAVSIRGRF